MTAQLDTPTPSLGAAYALKCRECGATSDLDASYACMECFGPLEVAYVESTVTREQIEAGPGSMWRYEALLPVAPGAHGRRGPPARAHPPGPGRQPGCCAGCPRRLGQGRQRQPDPFLQGPRRGRGPGERPAARLHHHRLRLHRQPRQRGRRRRGARRAHVGRLRAVQPRGRQDRHHRRVRRDPGRHRRQLRRRQPAVLGDRLQPGLGLRQRQPAALLRRGQQDGRVTRSPSSSAGGCPTRSSRPVASGSLLTKVDKAFREFVEPRAGRRPRRTRSSAPRPPAAHRCRRRSTPVTTSSARSSPTPSPSRWRSAIPRTGPTRSMSCAGPVGRSPT